MEENEDEPADVGLATPVEDEIIKGQIDEPTEEEVRLTERNVKDGTTTKKKADEEEDSCQAKKRIKSEKEPKRRTINIFQKECKPPKSNPVPRHCISKKEHLDILATPTQKCPPACLQKAVVRKLAPVSPRILELAKPSRHRVLRTLQERADILAPELLDNLIKILEAETSLSPEQASKLLHDKKSKKCKKKRRKIKRKREKDSREGEADENVDQSRFDPEAVCHQYQMAEKFVKSILDWKCPLAKEEFQDIAEIILRRLSFVLEYTPTDNGDRKSQQMRFLADLISCWITGVIIEVAEAHEESEEDRERRRQEEEEEETEEEEEEDILSDNIDEDKDDEGKEGKKGKEGKEDEDKEREGSGMEPEDKAVEKDDEDTGGKPEEQETSTQTPDQPEVAEKGTEVDAQLAENEVAGEKGVEEDTENGLKEDTEKEEDDQTKEDDQKEIEDQQKKTEVEAEGEKAGEVGPEKETEGVAEEVEPEKETEGVAEEETGEEAEKEAGEEAEKEAGEETEKEVGEEAEKEVGEEVEKEAAEEEAEKGTEDTEKETEDIEKGTEEAEKETAEEEADGKKDDEGKEDDKDLNDLEKTSMKKDASIKLFQTDLPFINFIQIFQTIYKTMDAEEENSGQDPIVNRVHRAVYEKCHNAVRQEDPDLLTNNAKDIINVMAGKIAVWLSKVLSESQVLLMNKYPPQVESFEVRDWSKWLNNTTKTATNWTVWLQSLIKEAQKMQEDKITRAQWQDWTKKIDTDAALWRRFHLDTVHQAHHNVMMIKDREVVKTGEKKIPEQETEIRNFDF